MKLVTVRHSGREATGQTEARHFTGTPDSIRQKTKQATSNAEEEELLDVLKQHFELF